MNLDVKIQQNIWDDFFRDVLPVLQRVLLPYGDPNKWTWSRNMQCKYIDLRIDMRDGGCIIGAEGQRISPERLAWQYSKETPEPPA
jgi:hypothetical protein